MERLYFPVALDPEEYYSPFYVSQPSSRYYLCLFQPTVTDSQGTQHNVVRVKKSDFQIIEALEDDGDAVKRKSEANKHEGRSAVFSNFKPCLELFTHHLL